MSAPETTAPAAAPPKKKRGCGFWVMVGLAIFVVLIIIGQFGSEERRESRLAAAGAPGATPASSASAVPVTEVTARELHRAFEENEVAAKAAYGNRRLKVSGTLASIDLDITDDPVLVLETSNMFQRVQAAFDKADSAAVSGLKKGQKVAVICDRLTEIAGSPMLSECVLAK